MGHFGALWLQCYNVTMYWVTHIPVPAFMNFWPACSAELTLMPDSALCWGSNEALIVSSQTLHNRPEKVLLDFPSNLPQSTHVHVPDPSLTQVPYLAHHLYAHMLYSETCLERPLLRETTCLEGPLVLTESWTFQCKWTCHQRPPVLRNHILCLMGRSFKVRTFHCALYRLVHVQGADGHVYRAYLQYLS